MNETLRLFFALEVPQEVKTELGKFGMTLERPWRPVKPELMHITLAFMGEVAPNDLERIKNIGIAAAAATKSFNLELAEASVFPETGDPKVLYAQAAGGDDLTGLVEFLRRELGELADQKKFRPHLTLARSRGERARRVIRKFRGSWAVQGFSLFKSTPGEDAPQYELIQHFPLQKEAAAE
jgi:2'-5' RNA ligase